jgi:hypothetical protein
MRARENDRFYSAGVHFSVPVTKAGILAAYLNRPTQIIPSEIPGGFETEVDLNHTTDILFASPMGTLNIGARLSIGLDKFSRDVLVSGEEAEETQSARYFGLTLGGSNEMGDFAVNFELPAASWDRQDKEESWKGFAVGLKGRGFVGDRTRQEIVPLGIFRVASSKREYDSGVEGDPTHEATLGNLTLGLGVGLNKHLTQSSILVLGLEVLGFDRQKTDTKDVSVKTVDTTTLPGLYIGLESAIRSWLYGRIGATQVYQSVTEKTDPEEGATSKSTTRSSQFKMTFGLGMRFGHFRLDASINEGMLFDGPNFLSGSENPLSHRLSAVYEF